MASVWQGAAGRARLGKVRSGGVRQAWQVPVLSGGGPVWQARRVLAWPGDAWRGRQGNGRAWHGRARQASLGVAAQGAAWQAGSGLARLGMARHDVAIP